MRTPSTSPSPSLPRMAALTHPVSSLMRVAPSPAGIRRECLEGDDCKGVLDTGQGLHLLGHEMADIGAVGQVALHQEVLLSGGRIDLGDLLDIGNRGIGHATSLAELAFDHDEYGLHRT